MSLLAAGRFFSIAGMEPTVLFADISGSSEDYQHSCIEELCRFAQSAGGRVIKAVGDEMVALFRSAEEAASAAASMHATIDAAAAARGAKLAVHVGQYAGDTVKLAARLLEEAHRGVTPTLEEATTLIGARIGPVREAASARAPVAVRLMYRQRLISYLRQNDAVVIGRHHDCEISVADRMASRRHCTIEGRGEQFALQDHSSNGTWIYVDGEKGALLKAESMILKKRGWIGFGPARFADSDVVEFFCS